LQAAVSETLQVGQTRAKKSARKGVPQAGQRLRKEILFGNLCAFVALPECFFARIELLMECNHKAGTKIA
jgi:hypothetical protein